MDRTSPLEDGGMIMTKTIRLTMDQDLTAKLEELADFHGESEEDTIRLLIRDAHAYLQRFIEEEIGQNGEKIPPREPQPDDEIPM
jgi:hypothetical protein